MFEKALYRFAFWSLYAMPLAGLTIWATEPLTIFSMWGNLHIPSTATYDSISAAFAMELLVFLALLTIPKIVIYFWGTRRGDWKKALWNTATYLILPIVVWMIFFMTRAMHFAWFIIALAAWIEALQIVFAPRLSKELRQAWHLD